MGGQKRGANKGFAFVMADPDGKLSSGDRKLIRSHVMRGKNTRASRNAPARGTPSDKPDKTRKPQQFAVAFSESSPSAAGGSSEESGGEDEDEGLFKILYAPNDVFMCPFADDIDKSSREMLFDFYSVIKEAMYPVEWCVRFDASKTPWFMWLMMDPAYLHSVLFTVSMLHDWTLSAGRSDKTNRHIGKTLKHLNRRLASRDTAVTDSTVATVVTVSMVAEIFGDRESSTAHVAGLRRIVELRGGVERFKHDAQLYAKICRVDIGWSLITGEEPVYYRENLSYDRSFTSILGPSPGGLKPRPGPCSITTYVDSLDLRLSAVFQDLRDFSRMVNHLFRTQKIDPNKFQELMTSVQYRLLYLETEDGAVAAESFRLAMLGYLSTLFLHILGSRARFAWLSTKLRAALTAVDTSRLPPTDAPRIVMAWMLIVGSAAVLGEDDDTWLLPKLASLVGSLGQTWPEAKESLGKVMWINNVHDSRGVKVFERLVLHVAKIPSPARFADGAPDTAGATLRYPVPAPG